VTVDERTRLRIRQWFLQQMDDEEMADAIMESMPPVDWSELATKHDLALTTRELRSEMGQLRVEMGELRVELKTEMGALRSDMGELRVELKNEMGELRSELKGDIAKIGHDLASFQRTMMLMLIGFALTIWVSLLVA
jgi:hypothetical protein